MTSHNPVLVLGKGMMHRLLEYGRFSTHLREQTFAGQFSIIVFQDAKLLFRKLLEFANIILH